MLDSIQAATMIHGEARRTRCDTLSMPDLEGAFRPEFLNRVDESSYSGVGQSPKLARL